MGREGKEDSKNVQDGGERVDEQSWKHSRSFHIGVDISFSRTGVRSRASSLHVGDTRAPRLGVFPMRPGIRYRAIYYRVTRIIC